MNDTPTTGPRRRCAGRPAGAAVGAFALAAIALASLALPAAADGKGSGIGGPPRDAVRNERTKFGIDPSRLTDAEKETRLAIIQKEYDSLKRNQDILQVRKRRNRVAFVGEMRYEPSAGFLRKVFDNDRDVRARVAALVAIGKAGDFDTIEYAVKKSMSSSKKDPVFASNIPRMFRECTNAEAAKWLVTRLGVKSSDVQASLVEAIGYTGEPSAVPELEKLIDEHKDVGVRFEAMRAYGRCAGPKAVSKLFSYLSDEDWRLRMAAAEGLGYAGEPRALLELGRLIIRGEEPIVVETASEAAARLGTKDAIPLLIDCLKVGRLRARQKARSGLVTLAKKLYRQERDYHVDAPSWESWWRKVQRGIDPDDPNFDKQETASYFTFPIHSDRVLFILDVSGSMMWPDAPRDSGIRPSEWENRRIDLAHRELFKALRALAKQNRGKGVAKPNKKGATTDGASDATGEDGEQPPVLFNLATFAGVTTPWKQEEVVASEENVEAGIEWIKKQLPRGGTATYDALEFGVQGTTVDTVFFLSDGVPSLGKYEEPETILSELRKVNRYRRVSINTVALIVGKTPIEKALKYEDPEEMADFMSRIATENYGKFADESRP